MCLGRRIAAGIALGLGLALPYLLIAWVPRLHSWLPRPGAWTLRLRQLLAFPMYATCAWLLWVLTQQAGADGLEVRAYVHDLYRHLAACDLAVVQGGLTTAMELTAARRPFLYFPLRHHFEQCFHVPHRLDRYRAGRRMEFDASTPEVIAQAIAEEIGRDVDYATVESDGARNAAQRIAELLN